MIKSCDNAAWQQCWERAHGARTSVWEHDGDAVMKQKEEEAHRPYQFWHLSAIFKGGSWHNSSIGAQQQGYDLQPFQNAGDKRADCI